jgi:hypothetical protein
MASALTTAIERFTSPQDEQQIQSLDQALSAVTPSSCGQAECLALIQVFERFPKDDGFGVFWSILHFLEATDGYEETLIESVLRSPTEFTLIMVNRLINGGVASVAGRSLIVLLRELSLSEETSPRAKELAGEFLAYQRKHGCAEA